MVMFGIDAHQRIVLHRVVRVAERAIRDPAADRDDRDRQAVMIDVVADLLGAAKGREVRDRISEDVIALARHARGEAGHVLLGDAGVDEAVGEALGEALDHVEAEIADHQRDLRIAPRQASSARR